MFENSVAVMSDHRKYSHPEVHENTGPDVTSICKDTPGLFARCCCESVTALEAAVPMRPAREVDRQTEADVLVFVPD